MKTLRQALEKEIQKTSSVEWLFFKDACVNADTEADARAKMLIYLTENGLIDPKNI